MDNHSRAVDQARLLENQLKQREADTRLTATRFGNLQTKYNEKEKELAKLQERYDRILTPKQSTCWTLGPERHEGFEIPN